MVKENMVSKYWKAWIYNGRRKISNSKLVRKLNNQLVNKKNLELKVVISGTLSNSEWQENRKNFENPFSFNAKDLMKSCANFPKNPSPTAYSSVFCRANE